MKKAESVRNVIIFLSGVIVSAAIAEFLAFTISAYVVALILVIVVLVLCSVYYFGASRKRIENLADSMDVSARYVYETHKNYDAYQFKGLPYQAIRTLVESCSNEILVSASYHSIGSEHLTDHIVSRRGYLEAIEGKIKTNAKDGITYIRINQMSDTTSGGLARELDGESIKHFKTALELEQQIDDRVSTVSVLVAPLQSVYTYVILDRRTLILEIFGVAETGSSYSQGAFIIQDRRGEFIDPFVRHFHQLERIGRPLTLRDIEQIEALRATSVSAGDD